MTINEADSQPQAAVTISTGPGAALRQAREAKGWTQIEMARRLNLRLAVIESIDSDHYKAGVALTFLRGYVKAYAKVVGVPEAQALAAFDSMSHEQFKTPEPMKSFSKKTRQQASDKWLKRISWLVFLGLLTSLIYWWWHDGGASLQGRQLEPDTGITQTETGLAQPTIDETTVDNTHEGLLPMNLITGSADSEIEAVTLIESDTDLLVESESEEVNPVPVVDDAQSDPEATTSIATNARLLTLSFTNDCWIKVTDSQGKVLSEGVKSAQQSLALEGEPPFKLILGVPTAVRAEYLGKTVDLSSFGAGRAARLTVPQS